MKNDVRENRESRRVEKKRLRAFTEKLRQDNSRSSQSTNVLPETFTEDGKHWENGHIYGPGYDPALKAQTNRAGGRHVEVKFRFTREIL